MQSIPPCEVKISGGLAGDGGKFVRTRTLGPSGATDDHVVAVGLYGRDLHFACGSFAGWVLLPARRGKSRAAMRMCCLSSMASAHWMSTALLSVS
ncbi:MAG: hypothetical protein IPP88_18845, partial [Betaproteobacteria bacterium]|nr:hypothetical protein [Betaproteobacteria bacterium]